MKDGMKKVQPVVLQEMITQEPITTPTDHCNDPRSSAFDAHFLDPFIFTSGKGINSRYDFDSFEEGDDSPLEFAKKQEKRRD
jgi:hypothetical protein